MVLPLRVYLVCVWCSSVACHSRLQHSGSRVLKGTFQWIDSSCTLLVPVVRRGPTVALAMKVSCTGGASQGIIGPEMPGANVFRSAAPYLPSSLDSASPPINWRRVESEAELACSLVTTAERLLRQALASVHHSILHPVQVSL
jgi:hypothetical protein